MTTNGTLLQNGSLAELATMLQDHHARRHDVIAPAKALTYTETGQLLLNEYQHELTEEGVTRLVSSTAMDVNAVAEQQLAERCSIPKPYWDRMSGDHLPLRAENANYWMGQDERSWMLRTLAPGDGSDTPHLLRAVLSNRYGIMDDLDVLMAALDGVRGSGIDPGSLQIGTDRTDRRMYVKITAPQVAVEARDLVARYRDPRSGRDGKDYPLVWAGLVITNSETGHGSFSITPRMVVQVCTNGMTRTSDVVRSVHLGERLDDGIVQWSDETQERTLQLVASRTADAVRSFLSPGYLQSVVDEMREKGGKVIGDPIAGVEHVGTKMRYTQELQKSILTSFLSGGDLTALGMAQAVTNVALDSHPDRAHELEQDSWKVLELAAAL